MRRVPIILKSVSTNDNISKQDIDFKGSNNGVVNTNIVNIILSGEKISCFNHLPRQGENYQRVADAYAGKSVLLTGGTGFLGKVMIERLLYNCKDIKTIYVLIRQKRDVPLEKRLEQMFSLPIFTNLKEMRPHDLDKVVPIQGDLQAPELGIKASDQRVLEQNVAMVFHLGAAVKFKESFKNLMEINYEGTRKILNLSKKIKNLETVIYFSTAFSNAAKWNLDEVIFPRQAEKEVIDECLRTGDGTKLETKINAPLYVLSKGLTENMVDEERGHLTTIMIRPSAVTATLRDPIVGWMESWIAHPSFLTEHSKGLFTVARGHNDATCDMIPCDYVCNLAIVAAARGNRSKDILIYNMCTSSRNPVSWKTAADQFRRCALETGKWELRPKELIFTTSPLSLHILTIFRDTLPALFGDLRLLMKGERPRYLKQHKRSLFIRHAVDNVTAVSMFTKSTNPLLLAQTLNDEDKVRFPFDANTIDWPEYIQTIFRSVHKYMLNKKK